MRNVLLSLFVVFCAQLYVSQVGNDNVSFSTGTFFVRNSSNILDEGRLIDGNPFATGNKFSKVEIKGYSKEIPDLRYNAFTDEMEYMENGQTYSANKVDGLTIYFPLLKKTFVCIDYQLDNKSKLGYLQLLRLGNNVKLYKREKVELLKGEKSPNAYGRDANDYYSKEKDLYLILKGNTFYKVPKSSKDLIVLLVGDSEKLINFTKSNRINTSKEEDLIKFVDYLNQN